VLATEHKCVLEAANALEREGFRVTILPVDRRGIVAVADLERAIESRTAIVSIMAAHNEIGVIQPLAEIGKYVANAASCSIPTPPRRLVRFRSMSKRWRSI